ncbi:MAG: sterol desaturase family protein [Elusimicrobia bacterium]|nr:sterol desaturase family protein [Elusimicrobiota bacterium]
MTPEAAARLGGFAGAFSLSGIWERLSPRRPLAASRLFRWRSNLGILALDALALRLGLPLVLADWAKLAESRSWGLFNRLDLPAGFELAAGFLALDLVIYWQHRIFHRAPILWRLHQVHHTDVDLDLTTGLRFHPLEILISMAIKFAAVAALGAHWSAVAAFEIVLNATSLFNHADINLPAGVDRTLRLVLVTPDMHRVHHSMDAGETNSNFSFNVPWWDWIFSSYRAQPRDGHLEMSLGLPEHRQWRAQSLLWLLALPFK